MSDKLRWVNRALMGLILLAAVAFQPQAAVAGDDGGEMIWVVYEGDLEPGGEGDCLEDRCSTSNPLGPPCCRIYYHPGADT